MKLQESMPATKVERSAKFVKTGFQIGGNYIKHYSKKLFNPDMNRDELNEDNASDIYNSLSELKGSALKIAQMLSMDRNMLPKAYVNKFSQSQYNAPPLSGPLIKRTFVKSFGKSPEKIFDTFNPISTNAASIGQVHQATLKGKKLAVKVQYPGVADSISSDLKMVKPFAFRLLGVSEKELNIYIKEVEERLLEETDYKLEVRRSIEFSKACSKIKNKIGQALWDFYNFQQHELKAVHADPHPGNFLITPDEKLAIIDFGCIKVIPDDFYNPFFDLVWNGLMNDKKA